MIISYFTKERSYLRNIMLYVVAAPILVSRKTTQWV